MEKLDSFLADRFQDLYYLYFMWRNQRYVDITHILRANLNFIKDLHALYSLDNTIRNVECEVESINLEDDLFSLLFRGLLEFRIQDIWL
jgi:hypothetical protein